MAPAQGGRGAHRDRDRGPQNTHRAKPEQGQGSVAASSPQTRAVRRVCPQLPGWQADGWIPTCAGAVGGTGAGRTQPSSSALALLALSSRGDWCPFPGRTVAHVAPRVSSHPGDDPDSEAFPSPAGAGSGPAPNQEVPESVPGPSLAAPRAHPGLGTGAGWRHEEPPRGTASPALGGHSLLLRAPQAQRGNSPGMLLAGGAERQQPAPVGSWRAAWLCSQPGAVTAQGTAIPPRRGKYLQAAARWSAQTCLGTEAEG